MIMTFFFFPFYDFSGSYDDVAFFFFHLTSFFFGWLVSSSKMIMGVVAWLLSKILMGFGLWYM